MDRQRLDPIISDDNPPSGDGYDVGIGYGTAAEVGDGSVFVPERQYDMIVHDGDRYRVTVAHERQQRRNTGTMRRKLRRVSTRLLPDRDQYCSPSGLRSRTRSR